MIKLFYFLLLFCWMKQRYLHFANKASVLQIIFCILQTTMNSELIISRLKNHYGFIKNSQLADFLGINASTLSGWAGKRGIGDWGLIFEKCRDVDFNWLLKGQYPETSHHDSLHFANEQPAQYSKCQQCDEKERMIKHLEKENERLWQMIAGNKRNNAANCG